ncbi:MAG TPA: hypothetical protein VH817_03065 [Thermoleophilaceae bacterium]|jgi:hypothetical protein
MADRSQPTTPTRRDRAVRRVRRTSWAAGAAAAGLATAFSVVAAHAFKGHSRNATTAQAAVPHKHRRAARRVSVPGPQHVPAIASGDQPLQPPPAPPAQPSSPSPAPAPSPQPQTSGGS